MSVQGEASFGIENRGSPLFYRKAVPLTYEDYRDKGLRVHGRDYGFSAFSPVVPLYVDEFSRAARHYPIIFTGDERPVPVAVLGLRMRNQFVRNDGMWRETCYVPVYVERYPFIAMADGSGGVCLAVDEASDHIVRLSDNQGRAEVAPFFEKDGKAAPAARVAALLCEQLIKRARETQEFGDALAHAEAFGRCPVRICTPDGSHVALRGFQMVDEYKLADLPEGTRAEWKRNGWAALINAHRKSRKHWQALVDFEHKEVVAHA